MTIRIGIVGPEDSVKQILAVTKEFPEVHFTPFIYENVYEVDELLLNNTTPIDQWFFSGVLNHNYALEKGFVNEENAVYPPLYGSSFFATLLEAQLSENKVFSRISIDSIANEELDKTLSFYNLSSLDYNNFAFTNYTYIHELPDFHEGLYKEGKAEIAITSTNYAYVRLKEKGVPVYRMKPSYLSIKLTLNLLIERANANRLKKTQIGIIGCNAKFDLDLDNVYYTYEMKQEELDVKKELLHLAKKVKGSFLEVGNGLYLIYTNRGEIGQEVQEFMFLVQERLKASQALSLSFSIGYGHTASSAEQHARLGLLEADASVALVIVDENKQITIPSKHETMLPLQYSMVSLGDEWEKELKDIGISISTVTQLISSSNYYHKKEFSSQDLSRWLNCSMRNARRILLQLERGDMIEQCGEIHAGGRGRPLRLYSFVNRNE